MHPGGARAGPHRAAVQPHPRRGRGAVRPGQHHPRRPHRRDRHAGRAAPPDPHVDHRRTGRPAERPGRAARRARPARSTATACASTSTRDELDARAAAAHRGRRAQPGEPAADAGGAVPAPLQRRSRDDDRDLHEGAGHDAALVGTWHARLRLALRRDRVSLPVWIVLLASSRPPTVSTTTSLYPDAASRAGAHRGVAGQPVARRPLRPGLSTSRRSAVSPRGDRRVPRAC